MPNSTQTGAAANGTKAVKPTTHAPKQEQNKVENIIDYDFSHGPMIESVEVGSSSFELLTYKRSIYYVLT